MVQLARSLLSWLAAASESTFQGPQVLSCSDSGIVIAQGSLTVGDIFIRVDSQDSQLCRDHCSVLFREILVDEGNGYYATAPASFAQVFPAGTSDDALKDVAVESVLPTCDTKSAHRSLNDANATTVGRKDHYDDDDHHPSSTEDDDGYHEKSLWDSFVDATKKFMYDMYCIIRSLDCTPYHPGDDDVDDDDHKSPSKDHRLLRRSLQTIDDVGPKKKDTDAPSAAPLDTISPSVIEEVKELNTTEAEASDGSTVQINGIEEAMGESSGEPSGETSGGPGESHHSPSKDSKDDDHNEDDFFDDDFEPDNNDRNFWLILDAFWTYVGSLMSIFGWGKEEPKHDDDYSSEDKHVRGLEEFLEPPVYSKSWLSQIFSNTPQGDRFQQLPASFQEWFALTDDGGCSFTKCSSVTSADQCFERQELVSNACRNSHPQWFSFLSQGQEDVVLPWDMDLACQSQVYCYASHVFGQTLCDEQFYKSLMQACPKSDNGVVLSIHTPLATGNLYEHCSLVSILLYSHMQMRSKELYETSQEKQRSFESNGCHR